MLYITCSVTRPLTLTGVRATILLPLRWGCWEFGALPVTQGLVKEHKVNLNLWEGEGYLVIL